MSDPVVSVVTSVFNGGRYVRPSLESVLAQEGVPFEFVLIDDGSTDGTSALLEELAQRDSRIRLIRQENQGLTRALVRGCAEARGRYIARHDSDDLSLPGRLAQQVQLLEENARLSFVSCWSRTIGPEDELLFETSLVTEPEPATERLLRGIDGPQHGSVIFRADAYRRVGGYRPPFRYAQDWDLWLRLGEVGQFTFVSEFLYAFRVSSMSISTHRREQQARLAKQAHSCRLARLAGESELPYLEDATRISADEPKGAKPSRVSINYFIGKCLLDRRDGRARAYLRRSLREDPWQVRGWAALAASQVLCRREAPAESSRA